MSLTLSCPSFVEQINDLRQAVQGLEKQIETLEHDKERLSKNLDEFSRHERYG